jgi:hypothetical protein
MEKKSPGKYSEEVEKTLSILSGIQKQESNPFTYEKVMMKLGRNGIQPAVKNYPAILKYSLLVLILIINLITVIKFTTEESPSNQTSGRETEKVKTLESIATEYNLFINY